jgi:actin-related protein 5
MRTGSSTVRAGWSFDFKPRISLPPLMARYRDRKLNRTFMFVGSDVFADGTARGQAKNIYEPGSNIVNNWDVFEGVLDYVFVKLGVEGANGNVDRPIVMTEPVANLGYARKSKFNSHQNGICANNLGQQCRKFYSNAMEHLQ